MRTRVCACMRAGACVCISYLCSLAILIQVSEVTETNMLDGLYLILTKNIFSKCLTMLIRTQPKQTGDNMVRFPHSPLKC